MLKETCVILCGGKSSRMGENKALLPFGEFNLLGYLVRKYKKIFAEVYLCCKEIHQEAYQNLGAEILLEKSDVFAPMVGLEASLRALGKKVFFVSVDCPFLQEGHFLALQSAFLQNPKGIIYAKTANKSHFLIGIYSPEILPSLREEIQKMNFKMSQFVESCDSLSVDFDDEESFQNLNTPSEYQRALLRIEYGK